MYISTFHEGGQHMRSSGRNHKQRGLAAHRKRVMCNEADKTVTKGYENRVSSSEFLVALGHRLNHLRGSCDILQELALSCEELLKADATSPEHSLNPYLIRASIVVMICATVEGILMDLGDATKNAEGLALGPSDLRGSSLEQASKFFKKVAGLRFPDQTPTWSKLKALFELRHAVAHTWGHTTDERRRKAVASLKGVVVSETGEAHLEVAAVGEALRIMRDFADELEKHLGGPQSHMDGT